MSSRNHRAIQAAALALAFLLTPAQAEWLEVSRNTGVGQRIAEQGNQALETIRAELKAAMLAALPALPKPRALPVAAPRGAVVPAAATVRCAK